MLQLPEELKQLIVEYVAGDDDYYSRLGLASLRLTNKLFLGLATPPYFKNIPLWCTEKSISNLVNLSKNDELACHVTTLNFSPLLFRSYRASTIGNDTDDPYWEEDKLRNDEIDAHGAALSGMQESLLTDGVEVMTAALKRLPCLECLDLSHFPRIGAQELSSLINDEYLPECRFDQSPFFQCLRQSVANAAVNLRVLILDPDFSGYYEGPCHYFGNAIQCRGLVEQISNFERQVLDRLEELILELDTSPYLYSGFEIETEKLDASLKRLLHKTPVLKTFHCHLDFGGGVDKVPMEKPLADVNLRYLVDVCLATMSARSTTFAKFFMNAAATLRRVRIAHFIIDDSGGGGRDIPARDQYLGWQRAIGLMRQTSYEVLQSYTLQQCLPDQSDEDECEMADFLTHRTEKNPLDDLQPPEQYSSPADITMTT